MSAYVLPNIILFVAIVGLLAVLARHIPEAQRQLAAGVTPGSGTSRQRLWFLLLGRLRSMWRFVLEAKGLHDPAGAKLRMKQLLVQNQRKVKARQQAVKITAASQVRAVAAAATRVARLPRAEKEPERELKASAVEQEATQPQSEVVVPAQVSEQAQPQLQALQNQADASMVLAKQYLDNRQFFEARKLLQSMDQSMHKSPVYWARLGYAQYHLGGYGEAVRCYERSLALDDQQPNRYYNLALAYQAAGNKPRAMSSLDKALRLDPGNMKYQETKQGLAA